MEDLPEQLLLADRSRIAIQLGEGHFREFKSAWDRSRTPPAPRPPREIARDIGDSLVGFANADGGELLVGVEDDGRITGVPHSGQELEVILSAPRTHVLSTTPLVGFRVATVHLDSFQVIYFQIPKSTSQIHQTSDGRCIQRLNTENRPVPFEQLRYERLERRSREYDREFVDGASLIDLRTDLLENVAQRILPKASVDRCLQYLDLLTYDGITPRLRRAALLLFGKDINRWHPRSQVRILQILGNKLEVGRDYNVHRDDVIQGNILSLVEESWSALRDRLATQRLTEGAVFRETILYPEVAVREALVNAIVHRDYSSEGSGIEIYIFNDRMEIVSPGSLLSDVPLESLRRREKIHQSRNSYIARCLRELGYVREMGEGIPRIFETLELHDLVPPELSATPHAFSLILHHRSIFSQKDRAWLESYKGIPLTRDEQRVMLLARDRGVVSPTEIMQMLNIVDTDKYRELVERMQWKGLLYSTKTDAQITAEWKRRKKAARRRDVPRLALRAPHECVKQLEELLMAVWKAGVPEKGGGIRSLVSQLGTGNPYAQHPLPSLAVLELLDDERRPTARLLEFLGRIKQEPQIASPHRPARSEKGGGGENVGAVELTEREYRLLTDELDRIIADSQRQDHGVPLAWVEARLPHEARTIAKRLGPSAGLVDFLSRQRDRYQLRWIYNRWYIIRVQ